MLRCYSRTLRSVGGWCWIKSGAKIKLLTFLRLCSIGLFPVYPARTKTLHCYLRRTKGSLVLEMRCILHRENSLQRERVFETVLRSGIKSFSMLRTGGSLGHLRTSGGAKHTGPWHWAALPFKPGWKVGRPPLAWLWRRRWWQGAGGDKQPPGGCRQDFHQSETRRPSHSGRSSRSRT